MNSLTQLASIEGIICGFSAFVQNDISTLTVGIRTAQGIVTVYFEQFGTLIKQYARIGDEVTIEAKAISPKFYEGFIFEFHSYKLKDQKGSLNQKMLECHRKVTLMQALFIKFSTYFKSEANDKAASYYLQRRVEIARELPNLAAMAQIVQQVAPVATR